MVNQIRGFYPAFLCDGRRLRTGSCVGLVRRLEKNLPYMLPPNFKVFAA
jgi:hypothetical protein